MRYMICVCAWLFLCGNVAAQKMEKEKYDSLVTAYRNGLLDYHALPVLSLQARMYNQQKLNDSVVADLMKAIHALPEDSLFVKSHLDQIRAHTKSSTDKLFDFFYKNRDKINALQGQKRYAEGMIDYVIAHEEVQPALDPLIKVDVLPAGKPDWEKLHGQIVAKYNREFADRIILDTKANFYGIRKDSILYPKYAMQRIERDGVDTTNVFGTMAVNNLVFNYILRFDNDTAHLLKALHWMEMLRRANPRQMAYVDTYANLLYKLGRKEEALYWQERAFNQNPKDKEVREAYEKMQKGLPTWKTN